MLLRRPADRITARLTGSWSFWLLVMSFAVGMPLIRSLTRDLPAPPPVFATLPPFDLIDEHGRPYGLADLRGRVWVADVIFLDGDEAHSESSVRMAELQARLANMGDAVRLVSFSVTPGHATPDALLAYARRYRARRGLWKFLTGPIAQLEKAAGGLMVRPERQGSEETWLVVVARERELVLVDQLGRVRGQFPCDDEGVQDLLNTLGRLANRGPG